nr:hypothetical protein Itr_chr12CG06210 [Ipomoea trifida]
MDISAFKQERALLNFGRRSASKITHVDLAALSIHHNGDCKPLLLVQPPHPLDDHLVPLPRAVAHVDSSHIHPGDGQRLQLLKSARGGTNGAHELGPPGAPEAILLELGLRDRTSTEEDESRSDVEALAMEPRPEIFAGKRKAAEEENESEGLETGKVAAEREEEETKKLRDRDMFLQLANSD